MVTFNIARTLDEPTLSAYRAAVYRIFGEPGIDMKIGSMNTHVASLMKQHDATSAVFVTAFNPFGRNLDAHENATRQCDLIAYIERLKLSALKGEGFDPKHEWQPEMSLFVLGATLEHADILMRAFEQNAVVHVDATGTPQLVLHPVYR